MTRYTPKVGDKVRCTLEGVVSITYMDGHILFEGGELLTPGDGWSFELIEAAPVPFEVGKPLTAEMGEPPVGSIITLTQPSAWGSRQWHVAFRSDDGMWYTTGQYSGEPWRAFLGDAWTLVVLGGGK